MLFGAHGLAALDRGFGGPRQGHDRFGFAQRQADAAEAASGIAIEIEEAKMQAGGHSYGDGIRHLPPDGCIIHASRSLGARGHDSRFRRRGKYRVGLYFGAGPHIEKHVEIEMSETAKEKVYSEAEIAERLEKELPKWRYENGWIRRKYKTHSWKSTLMVINTVGHLAEAAWHHPDITASYAWVEVRLMNHAAKGVTDKDFELAKKIEDVVQWQPASEGGALEGTPQTDQRFAYIKYD